MKRNDWIRKSHLFRTDEYVCSQCGAAYEKPYKVCPNCRSQMGKSRYDPSWVDEAENKKRSGLDSCKYAWSEPDYFSFLSDYDADKLSGDCFLLFGMSYLCRKNLKD